MTRQGRPDVKLGDGPSARATTRCSHRTLAISSRRRKRSPLAAAGVSASAATKAVKPCVSAFGTMRPLVAALLLSTAFLVGCGGSQREATRPSFATATERSNAATTTTQVPVSATTPGATVEAAGRAYAKKNFQLYCSYLTPEAQRKLIAAATEADRASTCAATVKDWVGPPPTDPELLSTYNAEFQAADEVRATSEVVQGNGALVTTLAKDESPEVKHRGLYREHGMWRLTRSMTLGEGGTNEEPSAPPTGP
jgi:hypothetical protein